jgi:pimeloyl-ACP methyl ester carboxylesterase
VGVCFLEVITEARVEYLQRGWLEMPMANVNGINIDYRVEGQGEPLIMICVAGADKSSLRYQTRVFKKYFRTVTFDNRGSGKSDKPAGPYTINMMADDTIGLLDYLGIEKAHVLGVSAGGMIAQELTIDYPDRVNRLILACTFARKDETSGWSKEFDDAIETYVRSSHDKASQRKLVNVIVDLQVNKWSYRVFLLPLVKIFIRFMPTSPSVDAQFVAVGTHDTADRLGTIRAPTLVITGTDDRLINPVSSELIASLVPGAKLIKVLGGGHSFPMEMSREFNREVLAFLRT